MIGDILFLLLCLVSVAIPVIHLVFVYKRGRRSLDDRRRERDSKKFLLTHEEIQQMKARAKAARGDEYGLP